MTDKEKIQIEQQDISVIKSGRNPNLKVLYKDKELPISAAREELIKELGQLASEFEDQAFIDAIKNLGNFKKNKFNQAESFHDFGIKKTIENYQAINSFSDIGVELCEKEASDSLIEFDRINQKQEIAFDEFVNSYNSKI
jgi:hypothetical protein